MANPKKDTKEVRGRISTPSFFALQALLLNPATSKPYYGGIGKVLEVLIENFIRHLREEVKKGKTVPEVLTELGVQVSNEPKK